MARTELPNGVILPAEYSDDWYEDMTSNLTKLDDVIGSDSEKLNSNDVAFLRMSSAALTDGGTGNFSDLNSSNKLKTGDYVLDSGRKLYQVVSVDSTNETFTVGNSLFKITAESDLAPVAESGDYDDLDNKPDLNPYDQHIADTDIHVTTADKTRWNNNTYVFRYSSTALTASSTNSNALLDNTDNLKVGDKVIDSSGVLFSITAIDTVNSTFTVGTALIDLAQDSDVVHKSGNETISGNKTFSSNVNVYNSDSTTDTANIILKNSKAERGSTTNIGEQNISFVDKDNAQIGNIKCEVDASGVSTLTLNCINSSNSSSGIRLRRTSTGTFLLPVHNNGCNLGTTGNRWYDTQTRAINGVEPSSLSLPGYSVSKIDISSYIADLTGGNNNYTAPANGYIFVRTTNGTYIKLTEYPSGVCSSVCSQTADDIGTFIPVLANRACIIHIKCSSIDRAYFISCLGNI